MEANPSLPQGGAVGSIDGVRTTISTMIQKGAFGGALAITDLKQAALCRDITVPEGNQVWPGPIGTAFPRSHPKTRADLCVYTHPVHHGENPTTTSVRENSVAAIHEASMRYLTDLIDPWQRWKQLEAPGGWRRPASG